MLDFFFWFFFFFFFFWVLCFIFDPNLQTSRTELFISFWSA
ncbi:hypothetical protein HanHA300_Chr06g0205961 [Helianthus annuus]|nr:hypothetical protein HanHA300_Chr06g0205961 [Helianthus annuus]